MTDLILWLEGLIIALDIKQAQQVAMAYALDHRGEALHWVDLSWDHLWEWVARARHAGWR